MTTEPAEELPDRLHRRVGGLVLLILTGSVLVCHARSYNFITDDAFIVARYARNVVDGNGWVYNVGDHVEGYTSFLWVAATALLGAVGVDFVHAVRGLSLIGALSCLCIMWLGSPSLGIQRGRLLCYLGPLLVAASGDMACWSMGGLEACGYAAIILASATLAAREPLGRVSLLLAGVSCGLCALMRPDGLLIPLALAGWLVSARGQHIWRNVTALLIPVGLIVGAHLLWRHSYYGDWLPNTYYAKVGASYAQVARGLRYVLDFASRNGGLPVWVIPFVAVWVYRSAPLGRALSSIGVLHVAGVIVVGGDSQAMHRFMVPIIPVWALLVEVLISDVLAHWRRSQVHTPLVTLVLRYALVVLAAGCLTVSLAHKPGLGVRYHKGVEVPRWTAAGKWLANNAAPDASIACVPIGAVGYYSRLRLYDMMGLTDRHIARKRVPLGAGFPGHEKHDGPYILSRKPTYLLLGNIAVRKRRMSVTHERFCRPAIPGIRVREDDIFVPELLEEYEPQVVDLPGGLYFHFLQRRPGAE